MFAIFLSNDTLSKALALETLTTSDKNMIPKYYINRRSSYYLVRGYVSVRGKVTDWAIIPGYLLEKSFDFDAEGIKEDWVQIVRRD